MKESALRRSIGGLISFLMCLGCLIVATSAASAAPHASANHAAWRMDAERPEPTAAEEAGSQAISLSLSVVPATPAVAGAASTESVTVAGCALTALPNDGSTSGNERAPNLRNRFGRAVYLILASELSAAGIAPGTAISGIGWSFQIAPGLSGSGPLIVCLQNTSDTTNSKSTTWATAIGSMTVAHNATTTISNVTGPFDILFSGGSPFTYTGGGLYVAFDAGYPSGALSASTVVWCNSTLAGGLRGGQSNVSAPAVVAASNFRPETRLTPAMPTILNDASVDYVVSYGAVPRDLVGPLLLQAIVTNRGANALTNLPVHLTVTGANSFTDSQTVASLAACGGQATVTFAGFTASTLGGDSIIFDLDDDDDVANNSKSAPMNVTVSQYSFKYPGTTASGGVGLTGATGALVGKFTTTFATSVTSVTLEFAAASATTYRVAVYADSGTGTPGAQLYLDGADRTVAVAGPVTIPIGLVPVGPGMFFAGIQQTNTTNASLSFDNEVPVRSGKFYLSASLPVTTWADFAPGNDFKLNIGVILDPCAGGPTACDDANPCTDDTCHPALGCVHPPNSNPCDDGNSCTVGDACAGGYCVGGPPQNCNDGNPCTDDVCDPVVGCVATNNTSPCDDGNVCTQSDTCNRGSCTGTPIPPPGEVPFLNVEVAQDGTKGVVVMIGVPGFTRYDVLSGAISALPVGPDGADETCIGPAVPHSPQGPLGFYCLGGDAACEGLLVGHECPGATCARCGPIGTTQQGSGECCCGTEYAQTIPAGMEGWFLSKPVSLCGDGRWGSGFEYINHTPLPRDSGAVCP